MPNAIIYSMVKEYLHALRYVFSYYNFLLCFLKCYPWNRIHHAEGLILKPRKSRAISLPPPFRTPTERKRRLRSLEARAQPFELYVQYLLQILLQLLKVSKDVREN